MAAVIENIPAPKIYDAEERRELTTAQAVTAIRTAPTGSRFALHVRVDLPVVGKPDHVYADAGSHGLSLSRNDALKIVKNLMSETLENKGARIPITTRYWGATNNCTIWIG